MTTTSSVLQPAPYPDEYLDYWCDTYVFLHLKEHGITVRQFLLDPVPYIERLCNHLPLLPQQRAIQARLDREEVRNLEKEFEAQLEQDAQVTYRNGAFIEPMHHCAFPRCPHRRKET
ncbi:MAG: hypothetical protein SV201_04860 [Pseudomonadota bacterium]|nr:hypothetical protein [Pseudomonadota bacterium]